MTTQAQHCCYISPDGIACDRLAEWVLIYGTTPDDYTETCSEHAPEMLTDAQEHRYVPIEQA